MAVTGGTVNIGAASGEGGNTFNINSSDTFISNTTSSQVLAVGDTFEINGVAVTTPQAVDYSYALEENSVLTVPALGVLQNDIDPHGSPLTVVLAGGPSNGTLNLNPDGSFTYTPNSNFAGTDSFTYEAANDRWQALCFGHGDAECAGPCQSIGSERACIRGSGRSRVIHSHSRGFIRQDRRQLHWDGSLYEQRFAGRVAR